MKKYLYISIRVTLGGLSNSIGRLVINTIPLYSFIFIRHLFITILSFILNKGENNFKLDLIKIKQNKPLLFKVISSFLFSSIGTLLFYNALKVLPVNMVSIFENGVYTLFTVVLSSFFLKEKIRKSNWLFLLLCLSGLTLIITKGSFTSLSISLLGLLLLTSNALLSSITSVITASSLKDISALTNTTIKSFGSALSGLLMIFYYKENFFHIFSLFTFMIIIFMIYNVISGFLIKFLNSRSIQEIGLSKTSIFTLLTPIVSSILGMIIFQDWFNMYQYIGTAIVVYSVFKLK